MTVLDDSFLPDKHNLIMEISKQRKILLIGANLEGLLYKRPWCKNVLKSPLGKECHPPHLTPWPSPAAPLLSGYLPALLPTNLLWNHQLWKHLLPTNLSPSSAAHSAASSVFMISSPPKTLASSWSGDSCCSLAAQSYTLPFADHPPGLTWKPKECEFLFKCGKSLEKRWSPSPYSQLQWLWILCHLCGRPMWRSGISLKFSVKIFTSTTR